MLGTEINLRFNFFRFEHASTHNTAVGNGLEPGSNTIITNTTTSISTTRDERGSQLQGPTQSKEKSNYHFGNHERA